MSIKKISLEKKPYPLFFISRKTAFFSPSPTMLLGMARRILVPQPGIKSVSPAVEAGSLNHWITREVPDYQFYTSFVIFIPKYFIL